MRRSKIAAWCGAIVLLGLAGSVLLTGGSARATDPPRRPRLVWSLPGLDRLAFAPEPTTGVLYVFDEKAGAPFAVDGRTGRRLWTAAKQDERRPPAPAANGSADELIDVGTIFAFQREVAWPGEALPTYDLAHFSQPSRPTVAAGPAGLVVATGHTLSLFSPGGQRLWRRRSATVLPHTNRRLSPRDGHLLSTLPLPEGRAAGGPGDMLADDQHVVVRGSSGTFLWDERRAQWNKLDLPPTHRLVMVVGGVLVLSSQGGTALLGLALDEQATPYQAMSAREVVDEVLRRHPDDPRQAGRTLAGLANSGLSDLLRPMLASAESLAYGTALAFFRHRPDSASVPLLAARLERAERRGERMALLETLAASDDQAATVALAKNRERAWAVGVGPGRDLDGDAFAEQVWRTGRSTSLGLCVPGASSLSRALPRSHVSSRGAIGTAHPVLFDRIAPDGRWVSICQAREDTDGDGRIEVRYGRHGETLGDRLRPYLVVGEGPGLAIDEVLASDPSGRHVAIRRGLCLDVVDVEAETITRLPAADLRNGETVTGRSSSVSFDADGKTMTYLRGGPDGPRVIVRSLRWGRETMLAPGPEKVRGATLDAEGAWVALEPPKLASDLDSGMAHEVCSGAPPPRGPSSGEISPAHRRVQRVTGGPSLDVAGLVRPFGNELLVRTSDGALALSDGRSEIRTLVPSSCGGTLLHADARRDVLLVACRDGSVEAYRSGQRRPLGTRFASPQRSQGGFEDRWLPGRPRYVPLGKVTVDLETLQLVDGEPLPRGAVRVTETGEERERGIYAVRGDHRQLVAVDARSSSPSPPEVTLTGPLGWRWPDASSNVPGSASGASR